MALKRKLTPEEFKALIPRISAAADAPIAVLEFEPNELEFDLIDVGVEELHRIEGLRSSTGPAVPTAAATLLHVHGRHPILIRVPKRVIQAFKNEAKRTGGCYQTLMNKSLKVAAEGFV